MELEQKGIRLELPEWTIGSVIEEKIRRGVYEHKESEAARKRLRAGMPVLEIGAGLGFVTSVCAAVAGPENVVSVEANPRMLDPIRRNLTLNGAEQVTLLHGAVVPEDYEEGDVPFHPGKLFWGGSIAEEGRNPKDLVSVPALRIDDLLSTHRPKFVMMDIEGAEQYLFDSRWPRFVRFVVLELHPSKYADNVIHKIVRCMAKSGLTYDPVCSDGRTLGFKRFDPDA